MDAHEPIRQEDAHAKAKKKQKVTLFEEQPSNISGWETQPTQTSDSSDSSNQFLQNVHHRLSNSLVRRGLAVHAKDAFRGEGGSIIHQVLPLLHPATGPIENL